MQQAQPCVVVESAGKAPLAAGQGRAAQPGALPALQSEKRSGENLLVLLAASTACPGGLPISAFSLSPL